MHRGTYTYMHAHAHTGICRYSKISWKQEMKKKFILRQRFWNPCIFFMICRYFLCTSCIATHLFPQYLCVCVCTHADTHPRDLRKVQGYDEKTRYGFQNVCTTANLSFNIISVRLWYIYTHICIYTHIHSCTFMTGFLLGYRAQGLALDWHSLMFAELEQTSAGFILVFLCFFVYFLSLTIGLRS